MTRVILPDVLEPGMRAVFCGTRAGQASAERRSYYAGHGNKFWPILHTTGLTSCELEPGDFERIREFGLGLTDLGKTTSGPDASIRRNHFDVTAFRKKMEYYAPGWVAFNGLKAARSVLRDPGATCGPRSERIGNASLYVLPSTSGGANACWDAEWWTRFAELIRGSGK